MDRKQHRLLRNIVVYGLGVSIISFIIYKIGIFEVYAVLASAHVEIYLLAVFIYLVTLYVLSMRWNYLLKLNGYSAGSKNLLLLITMGQFINNVTPSMKGGSEPFRAYYLSKLEKIPYHVSFSAVVIERILDSIIFLIFSFFVIIYFALSGVVYTQAFVLAWFLVMTLTVTIIYLAMHKEWAFKITLQIAKIVTKFSSKTLNEQKIKDTINKFQKTMIFFKGNRKGMLTSLIISSVWWILDIFRIYVLFIAISTHVAFISVASTYLVALLVGILPTLPGGLGTSDTAMIAMYSFFKIPYSNAAAGTLLDRSISYMGVTIIGSIAFKIIKKKAKEKGYEVES
uniref:Lysylphosphatidylglycerol synthase-like protein n=1 Tax=Methanococcus maripaludis (strain C6 / ATCC BAA-1332) TaxID=444158 RepID=A9A9D8_METM6